MTNGDQDCHQEHSDGRNGSSQIKQQHPVPEECSVRTVEQRKVSGDQENANLRGTEDPLRKLKAR